MTGPAASPRVESPPGSSYPAARRSDVVEQLAGRRVADPYRWLEDPDSAESRAWLAAQDELAAGYLAALPARAALAERIAGLAATGLVSSPVWRGERCFLLRREPGQEHATLITSAPGEPDRTLLDPMALDPSGAATLDAWQPDNDGRRLAYQISHGGDEEAVLQVMDVASGERVDGPINRCRYTQVAWLPGGEAYYYVRRLAPEAVPADEAQYHHRVYLHTVGTAAEADVLVFGEGRDKTDYYQASVSWDGRWLAVTAAQGTSPRTDVWLADLAASSPTAPALRVVQAGVDARTGIHVGRDGRAYVFTDAGAPRGRLAVADPSKPEPSGWRDLIAEDPEAVLEDFAILDGEQAQPALLIAVWTRHGFGEITVHDLADGTRRGVISVPGPPAGGTGGGHLGTISQITERPEGGHEAWFAYTDHSTPVTIYRYDARTGEVAPWARAPGSAQIPPVSARQVTYRSADGTEVRMVVIGPPGAEPPPAAGQAAPRPAILTGYGGFSISLLAPAFSPAALAWAEAGGVYAIAGLRGGSEEGEEWHRAGMREHKQRVFDDFHAAAAKLIDDGWTTPGQLAISGGSNGGLLVGAALTQWPESYAAVACSAPLLDMVRYEKFGLGQLWYDEYGTAADPVELGWLLSYSPYHHVREDVRYPAVLFALFEGDTRVDPMHASKMCAALQHATSARLPDRPILLRREAQVGHGPRAVSRSVGLSADTLAFLAFHTGLTVTGTG
ncbi:MAG TPA: prolyl oligopeptidase family serine peptidase [Streptosporangiaceae bacterium]|nr:prolyl oligopeptidase family serine peptidase [Streptosporangiaceae bacterium]